MERIASTIKNILKELLVAIFILLILISFIAPVITLWGGLYYDTVHLEMDAIKIKTSIVRDQFKTNGRFVWNDEKEDLEYDN